MNGYEIVKVKPIHRINEEQVKSFPLPFTCFLTQTLNCNLPDRKFLSFFNAEEIDFITAGAYIPPYLQFVRM